MKKLVIAFVVMVICGTATAGAPWTYVDLGYVTADSGDERTDGINLRGSFGFADMWHVGGSVGTVEVAGGKDKPFGADVTPFSIYVGLHPGITDNLDLVVDLGYESAEIETGTVKDDINAVFLRAGPRMLFADRFELFGYLTGQWGEDKTESPSQDFTQVGAQIGGQFYFTPAWSLGAEASFNRAVVGRSVSSSGEDVLSLFVRWSFAN